MNLLIYHTEFPLWIVDNEKYFVTHLDADTASDIEDRVYIFVVTLITLSNTSDNYLLL